MNLPQGVLLIDPSLKFHFYLYLVDEALHSKLYDNNSYKLKNYFHNNKHRYTQIEYPRTQICTSYTYIGGEWYDLEYYFAVLRSSSYYKQNAFIVLKDLSIFFVGKMKIFYVNFMRI